MLTSIDILSVIEEQKASSVKQLAKILEINIGQLEEILTNLSKHRLIEYNPSTGKVSLPSWLTSLDKKIEAVKSATGEIVLPRYQEIRIQDMTIGNFTRNDLELKIRVRAKLKEIAICDAG